MSKGFDQIRIQPNDREEPLYLIGASFQEMLQEIRTIPGRQMHPTTKVWHLPYPLPILSRDFLPSYHIVDEEGLKQAQKDQVRKIQRWIAEHAAELELAINVLTQDISRYSRGSESRIKVQKITQRARMSHALEYSTLPVEELDELAVATLYCVYQDDMDQGLY